MTASSDDSTTSVLASLSAVALAAGLLVSVYTFTLWGEVIVAFVLAGVCPTLLGYAGLAKAGALPWQTATAEGSGGDQDLVEELKRRYATGELDDAEMERKVETLLAAEDDRSRERTREPEYGRVRR